MINFKRLLLLILTLPTFLSCDEEVELTARKYPRIKTLPVTEVSENGATFNAEIIVPGDYEIIRYGFLWHEYEDLTESFSHQYIDTGHLATNKFTKRIESTLEPGETYYTRFFIETDEYLVYGPSVSFESQGSGAPVIETVTPTSATAHDTLVIKGEYFTYYKFENRVTIGARHVSVVRATDKEVVVIFPPGLSSENELNVTIAGYKTTYDKPLYKTTPEVTKVYPKEVSFYDTLHIEGNHFCWTKYYNTVKMEESNLLVLSADKTHLTARVPQSIETLESELTVTVDGEQVSCGTITLKAPEVQSVAPSLLTDPQQLQLTLTGENFHPVAVENQVIIGGEVAEVVSASHEELVVVFPVALLPEDTSGFSATYDVEVTIIGQTGVLPGGVSVDF